MSDKVDTSINLRYISRELSRKLKVRAAEEGVTLQSLCVNYLWLGLEVGNRGDSSIGRAPTATPLPEAIPTVKSPAKEVAGSSPAPRSTTEFGRVANQIDELISSREHDPRTCRVYGCGMCAAAKGK